MIALITRPVRSLFGLITGIIFACLDTLWEVLLGGIGAAVGAAVGFSLAIWTPLGDRFTNWLSVQLPLVFPDLQITVGPELLLFALAGLGTGWGLTLAGGFGQKRRPIVAGIMGTLGYSVGWLVWQAAVSNAPTGRLFALTTAVAAVPLVLGLGLPSHYLVHALVAAAGTGVVLGGLVALNVLPASIVVNLLAHTDASWLDFVGSIALFCLWGVTLGLWLGVSYYLLVPVLRWLGWR